MDMELRLIRRISKSLPPIPHATALVNRVLKPLYLRKKRLPTVCTNQGVLLELDPHEAVDSAILFQPVHYDREEIEFLKANLGRGGTFVDVGANVGIYSLVAAHQAGATVLSIEADPHNFGKLMRNIELNGFTNCMAVNEGVSDKEEVLNLALNLDGNRGNQSFLDKGRAGPKVPVRCRPLVRILAEAGVSSITGLKIDIEGFEYRVLHAFFQQASPAVHPSFIIIEYFPKRAGIEGGDCLMLLSRHGYSRCVA